MFELIEYNLEVLNALIALIILFLGFPFLQRLQFTLQKKAVRFFLIGIVLFAITEILAVTNIFVQANIVELFKELAETSFIISIAIGLFFLKEFDKREITLLQKSVVTDDLTKLYNQAFFRRSAQENFIKAKIYNLPLSFIMLDIDNFKSYNDQFGHEAGNYALQCLASELKQVTRINDLVARYGGEEFIIVANSTLEDALILAKRICNQIASNCLPKYHAELHRQITVSVGLASLTKKIDTFEKLIEAADRELYNAKRNGKNQVSVAIQS